MTVPPNKRNSESANPSPTPSGRRSARHATQTSVDHANGRRNTRMAAAGNDLSRLVAQYQHADPDGSGFFGPGRSSVGSSDVGVGVVARE